jgi:uncharacterized protein CbrC (UPF0167 family)
MELPKFKYHPDPIATGSIVASDKTCKCCGQTRGYIYEGTIFAEGDLESAICPWCIADGAAHSKFDATFVDEDAIGDYGKWDEVSESVKREVAHQTPTFIGWQDIVWWTHCGDAAAFLGMAGAEGVVAYGPELAERLRIHSGFEDNEEWQEFLAGLDKEESPTAYVFRCLHCEAVGGYWDCD